MAIISVRRMTALRVRRNAMTLIEIMSSVLVLSIGLVGVLAAIPFGGLRLAQMNEADYSSGVGREAVRMMKFNGWANPANWDHINVNNGYFRETSQYSFFHDVNNNKCYNLTYPFLVDPISNLGSRLVGFYSGSIVHKPDDKSFLSFFYTSVIPIINSTDGNYTGRIDQYFHLPDDLTSGYDINEDETEFRPCLETEFNAIGETVPAFTGRYSWMASVYLKSSTQPFHRCSLSDITSADYDVVVFKDRAVGDEKIMVATVNGSGYQGGSVTLDLTTLVDKENVSATDNISRSRLLEQFETTKYLMLMGMDDIPVDGKYPYFCRWYRIANYSVVEVDENNCPTKVRVSLIGPNTPALWVYNQEHEDTVRALFFPGAIGVYSGTDTF